jgi:hypothetical protein
MVTASGELDAGHYGSILLARKLLSVRGAGNTYEGIYYVKRVTHKIKRGHGESRALGLWAGGIYHHI